MSKLIKSIEGDGNYIYSVELVDGTVIALEIESLAIYETTPAKPATEFVEDLLDALPPAEGPPATERQGNFIRSLCEERQVELPSIGHLTVPQASAVIDRLLALPKPTIKAPEGTSKVAPGYYAIFVEDKLASIASGQDQVALGFYRVQRAKEGDHAGKTFVMRQSGDNFVRIPKTEVVEALEAILRDPVKAGVRYGREIGRCCKCNRTLTDEASRKAGIGPECNKSGWNA